MVFHAKVVQSNCKIGEQALKKILFLYLKNGTTLYFPKPT